MRSKAGTQLKYLGLAGVFFVIIVLFTAFFKKPLNEWGQDGYVHLGDGFVYFAACLLPTPYAILAGAGGAALADVLVGGWPWIFATIPIKAVTIRCFDSKDKKVLSLRNCIMMIPAMFFCVAGYVVFENFIGKDSFAPIISILYNIGQSLVASLVFVLLGFVADKKKLKDRMEDYFV